MLTDTQCKNASCPADKPRARLADSGGLYLEVSPAGSKRWFYKFRLDTKEKRLALGSYPEVGLTAARRGRDEAKRQLGEGLDPVQQRQQTKLKARSIDGDTFELVALEWYEKQEPQWSEAHAVRSKRQLERDLFPYLGKRRMTDIEAPELLAVLRKIEARGAIETADRGLMLARQVWHFAMAEGRVKHDITAGLKKALQPYRGRHFAAITEPEQLGTLLRAIKAYRGGPAVRAALQLAPMLFQRPGELRAAAWAEIDFEAALWTIPAQRMKRNKFGKENGDPHLVPLSRQALDILRALQACHIPDDHTDVCGIDRGEKRTILSWLASAFCSSTLTVAVGGCTKSRSASRSAPDPAHCGSDAS
ncbi:integrase [Serpentinimonas maccroryi]|uniref:Integrase n=1 Tax=Serpentinimonas maccroryi TaxID=1458426 RepID=A0A060NVI1_9BURK|nr:integrase [Serpentinimonas maccroryi]